MKIGFLIEILLDIQRNYGDISVCVDCDGLEGVYPADPYRADAEEYDIRGDAEKVLVL